MHVQDPGLQAIFLPLLMIVSVMYICRRIIRYDNETVTNYRFKVEPLILEILKKLDTYEYSKAYLVFRDFILIGGYLFLTHICSVTIPSRSSLWKLLYITGIFYALSVFVLITLSNDAVLEVIFRMSSIVHHFIYRVTTKIDVLTYMTCREKHILYVFIKHFTMTCFIFRNMGISIQSSILSLIGHAFMNSPIIVGDDHGLYTSLIIHFGAAAMGLFMGAVAREYLCLIFHDWHQTAWLNLKENSIKNQITELVCHYGRVFLVFIITLFFSIMEVNAELLFRVINPSLQDVIAFLAARYILLSLLYAFAAVETVSLFNNQTLVLGPCSCLLVLISSLELSMSMKLF